MDVKKYNGQNIREMPKLLADGRTPMTPDQLFAMRLDENLNRDPSWGNPHWEGYFDTGAVVLRHPDGRLKTSTNPSKNILKLIDQNATLSIGLVVTTNETYDSIEGKERDGKTVKKWVDRSLPQNQTLKSPLWRDIAPETLDRVVPETYKRGGFKEGMAIRVPFPQETSVLGLWQVGWLGRGSNANGNAYLNDYYGCLLGVARQVA